MRDSLFERWAFSYIPVLSVFVCAFQTLFVSKRERVETSEISPILSLAAVVGYFSFECGRYNMEIPYYQLSIYYRATLWFFF